MAIIVSRKSLGTFHGNWNINSDLTACVFCLAEMLRGRVGLVLLRFRTRGAIADEAVFRVYVRRT
jgi:hypothetical protein